MLAVFHNEEERIGKSNANGAPHAKCHHDPQPEARWQIHEIYAWGKFGEGREEIVEPAQRISEPS